MRDVFEVTPAMLEGVGPWAGCDDLGSGLQLFLPYTKPVSLGASCWGLGRHWRDHGGYLRDRQLNQLDSISLFQAANSITSALANEFAEG